MKKIKVKTPLVEMDGDEMTRIMWKMVKEKLLFPWLNMDIDYFDLHITHRDETHDRVTADAAQAIMKYGVGVKCATITPNQDRVEEYHLKEMWKSPNGTIRAMLDGTVFRKPILVRNIKPFVSPWKKPITIGRHAYGDVYDSAEMYIPGEGRAEIVFTPFGGSPQRTMIKEFKGPGIIQGIHNTDDSILSFARACFTFALDQKMDLWFSTKDTISKIYDAHFRDIFEKEYEKNWNSRFKDDGHQLFLHPDRTMPWPGSSDRKAGWLWALKNYDGDVMSDMVASACGSLAMMTSVLVSPRGWFEYEAAHGTVQKHYYKYLAGEETSTNSMALIFAWTGGLRKRGELDGTGGVIQFAEKLEAAAIETIESGIMTGDLLIVADRSPNNRKVSTEAFIDAIAENLGTKLS